MEEKKDNW